MKYLIDLIFFGDIIRVEEIVNTLDKTLRKGFITVQILLILEKGPSYGYKIKKSIEKLTFGVWETPLSTLYTVLHNLNEEQLIEFTEKSQGGRMRKVYEITSKGKETLKIILKEYLKLRESLNSLISYTIGTDDEFFPIFFQMMGLLDSFFKKNPLENYKGKSEEELKLLEFHYSLICQKIKDFMNLKQKYGKTLLKLKKKLQMKKFEEKSKNL